MESDVLAKIDHAVEDRMTIERIHHFNKFKDMYAIAADYVQKNALMVFGGFALNLILPPEKQFYDAYELPDLDVFCVDPTKEAKRLQQEFVKRGYAFCEIRQAMHEGSIKLFVELQPMVDFRQVPAELHKRFMQLSKQQAPLIRKNSSTPDFSFHVAPLDFLRFSIYHELSEPHGEVQRWRKVFTRFLLFHQIYPFTYPASCLASMIRVETRPKVVQLLKYLNACVARERLPYVGVSAFFMVLRMLGVNGVPKQGFIQVDRQLGIIEVLSDAAEQTAQRLIKQCAHEAGVRLRMVRIGEHGTSEHHVPMYCLYYDKTAVIGLHQSVSCHAVIKVGTSKVASIDTQIRFLFHYIFAPISEAADNKRRCMINMLTNMLFQSKYQNKAIVARFILDCYGYQASLDTARRAKRVREDEGNRPKS